MQVIWTPRWGGEWVGGVGPGLPAATLETPKTKGGVYLGRATSAHREDKAGGAIVAAGCQGGMGSGWKG